MQQEDESPDGILTLPFLPSDTDGCDISGAENPIEIQANAPSFAEMEMERELLTAAQKRAHEIIADATNGILHIESFVVYWSCFVEFSAAEKIREDARASISKRRKYVETRTKNALRVLEHEHNAAMQVIDAKVSNKQFPPITSAIFLWLKIAEITNERDMARDGHRELGGNI